MHPSKKAFLFAGAAIVFWSTVASAFKLTLRHLEPIQLVLLAAAFSAFSLFLVLVVQNKIKLILQLTKKQLSFCFVLGLLNPCLYYSVLFEAYDRLAAQEAMSINYSWPAMLVILSIGFLKQRVRILELAIICVAYLGVVVIATEGNLSSLQFDDPLGVGLALASTLIWATFWLLNVKQSSDAVAILFLSFLLALPVLFTAVYIIAPITDVGVNALIGAAYIGFFEMGITFVLWLTALKLTDTTAKVSTLIFITPFLSLVVIHVVVGEPIKPVTLLGLTLIVAGIALQTLLPKQSTGNTNT